MNKFKKIISTLGLLSLIVVVAGVQSASAALTLDATTVSSDGAAVLTTSLTAGAITVGATAGTGIITLGRSTAGETINIGNGNVATGNTNTINIGATATSTGKDVITIGNTTAASSLALAAGTGNILLDSATVSFAKEVTHILNVAASTTTNTGKICTQFL